MNSRPLLLFEVPRWRIITRLCIDALFIILFLYAGITKLIGFSNFYSQLSHAPFISDFAGVIAWLIPILEIATALSLAFANNKIPGMTSSLILMTGFTLYVALVLGAAKHIPCTCGGLLQRMDWTQHLIFNIAMLLLAGIGLYLIRTPTYVKKVNEVLDMVYE